MCGLTLQNLDLNGCWGLQKILTSIGQLSAHLDLDLNDYSSLKKLPTSIGQWSALQDLDL
jgi:hypothetical protein